MEESRRIAACSKGNIYQIVCLSGHTRFNECTLRLPPEKVAHAKICRNGCKICAKTLESRDSPVQLEALQSESDMCKTLVHARTQIPTGMETNRMRRPVKTMRAGSLEEQFSAAKCRDAVARHSPLPNTELDQVEQLYSATGVLPAFTDFVRQNLPR